MPASKPSLPIRKSKRLFDIFLSLLLLILLSPIFLLTIVFLLVEHLLVPRSRGSVFYREPRISRGRLFPMLKFRTARQSVIEEAKQKGDGRIKTIKELEINDENLIWTGKFLKNFYLDELPQLINILLGHMSFVGPRPWPEEDYQSQLARGVNTKGVIPCGLTGLYQCNKGKPVSDLELDLEYIEAYETKSALDLLRYDLTILARSFGVMLEGKGI